MKNQLTFKDYTFTPVDKNGAIWLTANDLATALGYADVRSVNRLFMRNSDEFSTAMSLVAEMTTSEIKNSLRQKRVRIFSLRGAHLIAVFACTDVAKEFRRWVLDILDCEVVHVDIPEPPERLHTMHLTNSEVCSMAWLYKSAKHMRDELEMLAPKLESIQSPLADSAYLLSVNNVQLLNQVKEIMIREVGKINQEDLIENPNWKRVLPDLNIH